MEETTIIPATLERKLVKLAPTWYQKLKDACFNRDLLPEHDNKTLGDSYACCFIGEAHGLNEEYTMYGSDEKCEMCKAFACDILYKFAGSSSASKKIDYFREVVEHFENNHNEFFNVPVANR
jgi:hypothetical protein